MATTWSVWRLPSMPFMAMLSWVGLLSCPVAAGAEESTPPDSGTVSHSAPSLVRIDGALTVSHFQQQAKPEIGAVRGDRLVEQTELGVAALGSYQVYDFLHAGVFTQFDVGTRNAATFEDFDEEGSTQVSGQLGGDYWEWWIGPLLRAQYKAVYFEAGWGALGLRQDDGRNDVPNASDETDGTFQTTPSVAWLLALGGSVPLAPRLDLSLRVAYRVRYYTSRGEEALFDDAAMGSQNVAPFIGVAWYP